MTSNRHPAIHPLIRKLESIFSLYGDEREAVLQLPIHVAHLEADQDFVREGDRPSRSCAVLEGFTCTYQTTEAGGRQIVSFAVPGDIPDLQSLHLKTMDCSLGTLALLWQVGVCCEIEARPTVRAAQGWRSCEEIEDGLADGRHARLGRWSPDSFFSVPLP